MARFHTAVELDSTTVIISNGNSNQTYKKVDLRVSKTHFSVYLLNKNLSTDAIVASWNAEQAFDYGYISLTALEDYLLNLIYGTAIQPSTASMEYLPSVDVDLYGGTEIWLFKNNDGIVQKTGFGKFYNPKYNQSVAGFGIWNANNTYAIGETAIWGGMVWTNVNGNVGASSDLYTLDSEWAVVPYNDTDYNVAFDPIEYDIENDFITRRKDIISSIDVDCSFTISNVNRDKHGYSVLSTIKAIQWGNPFEANNNVGIGLIVVNNSYFENINFSGSVCINVESVRSSYIAGLTANNNGNIYNLAANNNGHIYNLNADNNGYINDLTANNNSSIDDLTANNGRIYNLTADNGSSISNLSANNGHIYNLTAKNGSIYSLTAYNNGYINDLTANNNSSIEDLTATNGRIYNLTAKNGSISNLTAANNGSISNLTAANNGSIYNLNAAANGKSVSNLASSIQYDFNNQTESNYSLNGLIATLQGLELSFTLDFDGSTGKGDVGAITMPIYTIPEGYICSQILYSVTNPLVSATGELTIGYDTDDATACLNNTVALINATPISNTAQQVSAPTTALRNLVGDVTTSDITAGSIFVKLKFVKII